jgi:methylenetetrahydrofolate dehydrogenase (NADP+) / methenyltetrahydrofolate cyclohydrolase
MTRTLSGTELAAAIRAETKRAAAALKQSGITPTLGVVIATGDESAAWYVGSIEKAAAGVGIQVDVHDLGPHTSQQKLHQVVSTLADNPAIHGIIIQAPLPEDVSLNEVAAHLPLSKDVDGAGPLSAGRLILGEPAFAPSTAEAVMELLVYHRIKLDGVQAVVLGRSAVVGKPVSQLLLQANATVMVAHSHTHDAPAVAKQADVLVVAIGKPRLVDEHYIKPGAVIIDVGTNPDDSGQLLGDVNTESVDGVAGAITPVPGGVGPVTTAILLRHVVEAAAEASIRTIN